MSPKLKPLSFRSRVREAVRLITGKQSVPRYRMADLDKIARYAVEAVKAKHIRNGYTSANTGRTRADWGTTTQLPYDELRAKQITIVARSRDLYKNDSTYRGAINTIVTNSIGCGLWPKPKVKNPDGTLNKSINKKIESLFNVYQQAKQWDSRKRMPFVGEGQRMAMRTAVVSGDTFLNAVGNTAPNAVLPVAWQVFEIDRLNTASDILKRNKNEAEAVSQTLHGINLDKYGAEISFNILGLDTPVPAKNIIHSFMADRPEQYIGVPAAVAALADAYDKHDLLEDFSLKSRAISKVMWILSNGNDQAPGADDTDEDGAIEFESMTQARLDKAPEKMSFSDNVNDTVAPLVKLLQHGICSGLGTSYTTVTRDMDGVNFAASKFIDIQEWRFYNMLRDWFVYDFCQPFYERFLEMAIITRRIPEINIAAFQREPYLFTEAEWVGNGKQDVDPLKDMNADVLGLKSGIYTLGDVISKRGKDLDDHLDELEAEKKMIDDRGLRFDFAGSEPEVVNAMLAENPDKPEEDNEAK